LIKAEDIDLSLKKYDSLNTFPFKMIIDGEIREITESMYNSLMNKDKLLEQGREEIL